MPGQTRLSASEARGSLWFSDRGPKRFMQSGWLERRLRHRRSGCITAPSTFATFEAFLAASTASAEMNAEPAALFRGRSASIDPACRASLDGCSPRRSRQSDCRSRDCCCHPRESPV